MIGITAAVLVSVVAVPQADRTAFVRSQNVVQMHAMRTFIRVTQIAGSDRATHEYEAKTTWTLSVVPYTASGAI